MNVAFSEPVSAATWTINEADMGMQTNTNIQNIINNANPGDTILFTGPQYTHIHLSINKPLNIVSRVGTQLYACPMEAPQGSDNLAAFSINNAAAGTNISGFKINNNNQGYGININGTSNVNILNNTIICSDGTGINVFGSGNITVKNNTLTQSISGIKISNSSLSRILSNLITANAENGILFGENVSNTVITYNNITRNLNSGINLLESCNNVTIKNNAISLNNKTADTGYGIYINSTISGLNITGNFIYENGYLGICDDIGVNELTETTQNIENNYITGHTFRDVVRYVEVDGNIVRKEVWLKENCFGGLKRLCPSAHILGDVIMGNISQSSPGIFSVSFVDKDTGLTANGLGSFYVTFFLNKNNISKGSADISDIWKEILVVNGTATANFTNCTYKATNNSIFVIAPYSSFNTALKNSFAVNDSDIPTLKANISATSSVSRSIIKNGDTITYKITVKNSGKKNATNVKVSNILSPTYYSSYAKPTRGSYYNSVWNIGNLNAGETLTLYVTAKAKLSGITKSQAKITGNNTDPAYSNAVQTTINKYINLAYSNAVLTSSKVKTGKYVYLGTTVKNSGKDKSGTVKVKITLPKGMKLISVNYPSVYNKVTKTWTFTVPAGKYYTFKVKAQVTSKGTKKVTFNNNGKIQYKYVTGY
ncbi:right-handed parallel beta-helix repeat-containing protein [Methanobacterium arcticum]|uniref:right-handed parallel beta-helix repeat-containing protein n=1 Tax=Methanobacterium arcticum TaxID=386456 RepID=UPI00064FD080|nr:right-handed parallel beta-helix repeat-containing protein [Methanobacterium arcticum]